MPRKRTSGALGRLLGLRGYKRGHKRRRYARFYGRYKTTTGKVKGFEWQVKVSERIRPKALFKLIRHACGKLLHENALPVHRKGETFPNFITLFRSRWVHIRKILNYDVAVRS